MKLEQVKFMETVGALAQSSLRAQDTEGGIEFNQGLVTFKMKGKSYVVPMANVMWAIVADEKPGAVKAK